MKLTLLLSLLFAITIISGMSFADATKATGTPLPRTGVDICGDRLCGEGEEMSPKEKLGYYLLSLIEFDDSTVIQQGRFSVGGVAQQSFGGDLSSPEIKLGQFSPPSSIDRGLINSMAVPLKQPTIKLQIESPLKTIPTPKNSQNLPGIPFEKPSTKISINRVNIGNLEIDKFVNFVDDAKVISGNVDREAILASSGFNPMDVLKRENMGRIKSAQVEFGTTINPVESIHVSEIETPTRSAGTFDFSIDGRQFSITREQNTLVYVDDNFQNIPLQKLTESILS